MDKHSLIMNTYATSSNVFIEGINDDECMIQDQNELIYKSWSDMDEDENQYLICECQFNKTTSKVKFENQYFCYDEFIIEFSKLENESKHMCNVNLQTIFNIKPSRTIENKFEKEVMLGGVWYD